MGDFGMPVIPAALLSRMYVKNSLRNTKEGLEFILENRLASTAITGAGPLTVDGRECDNENLVLQFERSAARPGREREPLVRLAESIDRAKSVRFDLHTTLRVVMRNVWLAPGEHRCTLTLKTREVGDLVFQVADEITRDASGLASNGKVR